jgi:hypothetical protein
MGFRVKLAVKVETCGSGCVANEISDDFMAYRIFSWPILSQ